MIAFLAVLQVVARTVSAPHHLLEVVRVDLRLVHQRGAPNPRCINCGRRTTLRGEHVRCEKGHVHCRAAVAGDELVAEIRELSGYHRRRPRRGAHA